MSRVIIVGGGISGLSLAYRLQEHPALEVVVLEQRDRPGGCMWTDRKDGFQVETGPNGFLDNKPSTVDLCAPLGLTDRLVAASEAAGKNRYLFLDGKLKLLPRGLGSFLTSGLLSWRGKLSFLAERFRPGRSEKSDESIDAFARRRAGPEVAEVFADAFVTGIHGGDPALLSARAAFPRLVELEEQHGSVIKGLAASAKQRRAEAKARGQVYRRGSQMWSFLGGLRVLVEAIRDRLRTPPVTGVTVRRIEKREPAGWTVRAEGRDAWDADAVVLACPAYAQRDILADLDAELAGRVGEILYNRIAVVALGYREADVPRRLDGFGYIAPQRTRRDLLGVQWCSSIFPERAPSGMALMRALCGGWNRPEIADWDDSRLVRAVRAELNLALGVTAEPAFTHIIRWPRAIPQYHIGHLERVAWITERLSRHPGLVLGGNAYHGVAINDCTEQAEVLAAKVLQAITPTAAQ